MSQAISQTLRNQQEDGIRSLYVYAQLALSLATDTAKFATNGTTEEFWSIWHEKFENKELEQAYNNTIQHLKNQPLSPEQKNKLFAERFRYVRAYFVALENETILPTMQDTYLYNLCRPDRLMDLIYNFVLFDNGEKKIARYQQYFAIKKSIKRITTPLLGETGFNRKILPYNPKLKERAKELRRNMTFAEVLLWNELKQGKMSGFDFDRQRPIDEFIVDFYCKDLMLAIEIDGSSHDADGAYEKDIKRQKRLEALNVNFLRFNDSEVKNDISNVLKTIEKWIEENKNNLYGRKPTPAPSKEGNWKRQGGVIWHTQGSGKSLTMVMLAQAIALEKQIRNPKIVLVTDRIDLDDQITGTFRKCGMFVENATTGQRLVELMESKSDAVVTTVINKFEAAVKKISKPLESHDIFVLVDEGHRTQHGTFNIEMQKTMPNACFIAFTGTPLFKKDKSTAVKFGGMIDAYTVDQAVKDKAVVPLLYEGRFARQVVHEKPMDEFFSNISEPLTEYQKADLKKKFSRADQLNIAEQKIYAICWDISFHYRDNFQGKTPFKGQLVTQSKDAAIRYKGFLDEIGIVSTEVLISPIDEREGEDSAYAESTDKVKQFWKKMMEEHGTPKKYQNNLINRFKKAEKPEIIIVVDKLLTGFDEPKNTVLYLTRNLQGHTLLQAIARVNRVFPDKDYGYIIDYYGVIENLDDALEMYSSFEDFDNADLVGTLTNINEEIKKLPQKHSELWDIFKTVSNKRDAEAYQLLLKDEAVRTTFYDKLPVFAKILKLAFSSIDFHKTTDNKTIKRYKEDLAFFMKLRTAVLQRFSDVVDYKQYEGQIQKLIDTHIQTDGVETITELVNIFDKEKFQQEVENTTGKAAKADKIASRTAKHITEKMEEDPAFYKKFSQMLKDAIADYEAKRINEAQYLNKVKEIMDAVLSHTDADIPTSLQNEDVAKAFYGITDEELQSRFNDSETRKQISAHTALEIDKIIQKHIKVNWQNEVDIPKKMILLIGDFLIDEVRDKYHLQMSFEDIDRVAELCVDVAKIRYKR